MLVRRPACTWGSEVLVGPFFLPARARHKVSELG
jgi:hypothetical protein